MADYEVEVVTATRLDGEVARLITADGTRTRAALTQATLPGTIPGTGTAVLQALTGEWPNPARPDGSGPRFYISPAAGLPVPAAADGLRAGDIHVAPRIHRICTSSSATPGQATTWADIATGQAVVIEPGAVTPPVDPPVTPGTPAPAMTVRPVAMVQATGVWSAAGAATVEAALADRDEGTTASGEPAAPGQGVRLRLMLAPLLTEPGNDLLLTVRGAVTGGEARPVTAVLSRAGANLVPARTVTTSAGTASTLEYRWAAADLPILAAWDEIVADLSTAAGALTLGEVMVQSVPPQVAPPPAGPSTTIYTGSVFESDLSLAPLSKYTEAKRKYIAGAGQIILGCYDDAPLIARATQATPRVKITTTQAGGNASSGGGWADSVPIPAGTAGPVNRWRVLVVESRDTGEAWEFVDARLSASGAWSCGRGGKLPRAAGSGGRFPAGTGVTGSGLALAAAAITLDEAQRAAQGESGAIAHALGLNLPGAYYARSYWADRVATRSDGEVAVADEAAARRSVPLCGDRVRLRASFDTASLPPLAREIAVALKTWGAVIMGGSARASIICESGEGRATEPWGQLMGGAGADTFMSWLKAEDLEFVPAGWLSAADQIDEPEPGTVVPAPDPGTPGGGGSTGGSLGRIQIQMPPGVKWMSGASCRGIQDSGAGMGSPFAQWRGEPCYFGRVWWDATGADANGTLNNRWKNFHAAMDAGPGFFWSGESMSQAAQGAYVSRWRTSLQQARERWWMTREHKQWSQLFVSPAHEMNGNWYPWSVTKSNYKNFIAAWKRYREVQLATFPESILTFNANAQSMSSVGMDWRRIVPGYEENGAEGVRQWVDCGAVDYYNFGRDGTSSDWEGGVGSTRKDSMGGPWGIEAHRRFWADMGLPMTIPEWGTNREYTSDQPYYITAMNDYMRRHAGTGPGNIPADAYFNLSQGYKGKFAIMGDEVGAPKCAARYRELVWGN